MVTQLLPSFGCCLKRKWSIILYYWKAVSNWRCNILSVWWECCSFKDEKHLVFGFEEFPQILVDYLDCCIEQDNEDDREWVPACPGLYAVWSRHWLLACPWLYVVSWHIMSTGLWLALMAWLRKLLTSKPNGSIYCATSAVILFDTLMPLAEYPWRL